MSTLNDLIQEKNALLRENEHLKKRLKELIAAYNQKDNCRSQIDRLNKYKRMTSDMHDDKQKYWNAMMAAEDKIAEIKKEFE